VSKYIYSSLLFVKEGQGGFKSLLPSRAKLSFAFTEREELNLTEIFTSL